MLPRSHRDVHHHRDVYHHRDVQIHRGRWRHQVKDAVQYSRGQRRCAIQPVKDAVQNSRGQRRCAKQPVKDAVRDSMSKKAREALTTVKTPLEAEVGNQLYTL